MKIIKGIERIRIRNPVVALGNFDGVHRGHRKILKTAAKHAKIEGAESIAITFDPHPQQFIRPERGLRLLTTLEEREELICEAGIDDLVVIRFDESLRSMNYRQFVKKYLIEGLGARRVFVGYDYAFGKSRSGDVSHLKALGREMGFVVTEIPPVHFGGKVVKSRFVREFLSSGRFREALALLGHDYLVSGKVVSGVGRGRELGFPTANLLVDEHKLVPAPGVYAGFVVIGGRKRRCVVNIGSRPTFPADGGAIEVHILGFKKNIKGRKLKVSLLQRFRDELQFSDVKDLIKQIKRDVKKAARIRI